ncbi:low temperature requirement protein A [Demequina sp. NBRC 110057]|uniref:low temperature requirement protein A n=1 Tax=Demequina sp. NBRC 110057 TaxID=1570346 RepID=UPI000A048AF1|nr:low temperature requirement protein A [Demequina sp. NBRC 110057]
MTALTRRLGAHGTDEDHRVTTMELLFDVVYVFAFVQVTTWIAQEHTWRATGEGLLILAVLWWVWVVWGWLGNVVRADRGLPLFGFIVALVSVFGIAMTIDGIWEAEGGALEPLAFSILYLVIRVVHSAVYLWAARGDARLTRQIWLSTAAWIPAAMLLVAGALLPPEQRLWWWAGTVALEALATWVLSVRGPGWRVQSGSHFSERFDLVMILALGESVLSLGITVAKLDLTAEILAVGLLGVLVSISLWWPYFKGVGPAVEQALHDADDDRKPDIARDAYTYMHLPLVAGIILVAAGLEEGVMARAGEDVSEESAVFIAGGAALFALGAAVIMRLVGGAWGWLAVSAVFFAAAAFWLPLLDPTVAIVAAIVVLAFVAWRTPAARFGDTVVVEGNGD